MFHFKNLDQLMVDAWQNSANPIYRRQESEKYLLLLLILRNIIVHNHREEDLSTSAKTRLVTGLKINSLGQYTN